MMYNPTMVQAHSKLALCFSFVPSGPMVDSKVFICPSAVEVGTWMDHLESTPRPLPPAQGPLSYLVTPHVTLGRFTDQSIQRIVD